MKKTLFITILFLFISEQGFSQTSCDQASQQLQAYANQVNQIYLAEYWNIIPNQRCPAYVNGYAVNPIMMQNCRLQMLTNLNQWYAQQCYNVNNWYAQIVRSCTNSSNNGNTKPAPPKVDGDYQNKEIDTSKIEDLTAGVDEKKAVRITIPETVAAFSPQ